VCQQYKNTTTSWPSQYWYCGYQPSNALNGLQALQSLSAPAISTLTDGPYVLVFQDVSNSNAFLADNETQYQEGDTTDVVAAWYIQSQNRINLMEAFQQGDVVLALNADQLIESAYHEAGHVLDIDWGGLVDRSWVSQIGGNQQQSYDGFVQFDFRNLTYAAPAYTSELPACGIGAIFQGQHDPRSGSPICPLQGDLVGLNNQQILQMILPYYMTLNNQQRWIETWAQEIAAFSVQTTGDPTVDYYFLNYFPCSKIYVNSLYNTGALASLTAYPQACTQ